MLLIRLAQRKFDPARRSAALGFYAMVVGFSGWVVLLDVGRQILPLHIWIPGAAVGMVLPGYCR